MAEGDFGGNDFVLRVVPAEGFVDGKLGRWASLAEMGVDGKEGVLMSSWGSRVVSHGGGIEGRLDDMNDEEGDGIVGERRGNENYERRSQPYL